MWEAHWRVRDVKFSYYRFGELDISKATFGLKAQLSY
jgi:hypothetical protein